MKVSVLIFVLFLSGWLPLRAGDSNVCSINKGFTQLELNRQVSYLTDSSGSYSLSEIQQRESLFTPVTAPYINFKTDKYVRWLRFSVKNNTEAPYALNLLTKGIDSVDFYVLNRGIVDESYHSGSHVPINLRENSINSLLIFPFEIDTGETVTVYIRIRTQGYPLSAYPFTLLNQDLTPNSIKSNTLFQSIYLGGTTIVFLFGLFLALLFRQRIYIYYACFVLGSLIMMLFYNEYHYFIFDSLPAYLKNKNAFAILVTVNSTLYLLFAREYLLYGRSYLNDLLIQITVIATMTCLLVALPFGITLFDYRFFFYIFIFAESSLFFIMLIKSLRNRYKPAWLFLIGSMPIAALGFIEALSALHSIPIQKLHDIYYMITLWDMCFLTLGLVWRFKLMQDEQRSMQQNLFSMEVRVQDTERRRIAQDLHDRLGGLFAVLKLNLSQISLRNGSKEREFLDKSLNVTDMAAMELRRVAHKMEDNSLSKIGLVKLLHTIYGDSEAPAISIQTSGMEERLPTGVEAALYSIIQESITNALKHADASEIVVQITRSGRNIKLIIEDDGKGFDLTKQKDYGKGLANIAVRAKEHLKGDFSIDTSPGSGTVIIVKMKLNRF